MAWVRAARRMLASGAETSMGLNTLRAEDLWWVSPRFTLAVANSMELNSGLDIAPLH
jgi:hypothetical protein